MFGDHESRITVLESDETTTVWPGRGEDILASVSRIDRAARGPPRGGPSLAADEDGGTSMRGPERTRQASREAVSAKSRFGTLTVSLVCLPALRAPPETDSRGP